MLYFFLLLRLHRPQRLHNIELGAGGIRDLTLDANKIDPILMYRKSSFSKSVSTTFVAHCSFTTNNAGKGRILVLQTTIGGLHRK